MPVAARAWRNCRQIGEDVRGQQEVGGEGLVDRRSVECELGPHVNLESMGGGDTANSIEGIEGRDLSKWV